MDRRSSPLARQGLLAPRERRANRECLVIPVGMVNQEIRDKFKIALLKMVDVKLARKVLQGHLDQMETLDSLERLEILDSQVLAADKGRLDRLGLPEMLVLPDKLDSLGILGRKEQVRTLRTRNPKPKIFTSWRKFFVSSNFLINVIF